MARFDSASVGTPAGPVIEVIYAPMVGGSETLAFDLCREWRRRGVDARLCCLYGASGPMTRFYEEAAVPYDLMQLDHLSFYQRWRRLRAYLRQHRPHAVHVHHLGFLINVLPAAWSVGCRNIVYTEHSIFRIMRTAWLRWALPWCARRVRMMTCVSETLTRFFREGMRIPADRVITVYNGIDTAIYSPRTSPRSARDIPVIGAVGRLVEEKDYANLLHALARLQGEGRVFRMRIVGDGPLQASLQSLAHELGVADLVVFEGRRHDVAAFLRDIDVYVLSSRHEGLPIALMEAMASGAPIVTTAVGGVPELVRDGVNGLVVPCRDPEALARAVAALLDDPGRRRRLGDAASRDARSRFSIQVTAERYAELLNIPLSPVEAYQQDRDRCRHA